MKNCEQKDYIESKFKLKGPKLKICQNLKKKTQHY